VRSGIVCLSFATALTGCSTMTPTDDPMYLRITDLEARLMRIERVVNNDSLIELAGRVEQLQAETQALRGEIETLRFETENAAERQRDLYLDVDQRLQALETSQPRGAFPSGGQSGAFGDSGGVGAGGGVSAGAGAAASGAQAQVTGSDQDNYQAAFDLIQARRYEDAGNAFQNFLATFPDSPLADNAQYWLAETLYVRQQFEAALPQFERVIDEYPQSAKIPDALLKVGYCNFELMRWDQARTALQQVTRQYPDTTAARLAAQRLERITQEAG
jgi:tol-pal system protein YbgF